VSGEWVDVALKTGISLVSAIGGLGLGLWKWGRSTAEDEQAVKNDYTSRIAALREEMRTAMGEQAKHSGSRTDLLVEQFKESFDGIRRQIDEHRYYTEKDFLKKEDFRDFREEYREDMRDIKNAIAAIPRKQ
jgi:glucan phosphorylase